MSTVIAVYNPKKDCLNFEDLLIEHEQTLIKEGLVTEKITRLKEGSGYYLEIVKWRDAEAADNAHENGAVQKIWGKMQQVAEFCSLSNLSGAAKPFAGFETLPAAAQSKKLVKISDTTIAAKDYPAMIKFYENLLNETSQQEKGFATIVDGETAQSLCITDGPSVEKSGLSCEVDDLEAAKDKMETLGGKVTKTWEYGGMAGLNGLDPEGNELLLFATLPRF